MIVNGFRLPNAFVQLCEAIRRKEAPDEWELRDHVDAYGHPYQCSDLIVLTDPEKISKETRDMASMFGDDERLEQNEEARDLPGFVQDFTGVDNYVQFGRSITGEPFCFDFGADPAEPSVVTWTDLDCYWRRVAPNFAAFMDLFVPQGQGRDRREEDLPSQAVRPTPRFVLKEMVLNYVLESQESYRPFFEDLESDYADCSAEERREVETELREELEREGMTDDQRRTHDELWARLRATEPA
jgi:hypothetical protein